jgi:hypothetical protein
MVLCWQWKRGTAPKRTYHNKEFAAKMKAIGLYPSNSGMVGGRETGAHMEHYIIDGGAFDQSYQRLKATGFKLNLQSAPRPNTTAAPGGSKTPFSCQSCGWNIWGKPDTRMTCTDCTLKMLAEANVPPELYEVVKKLLDANLMVSQSYQRQAAE